MASNQKRNLTLPRLTKGGTMTLLDAQVANQLIDLVNALQNIEVEVTTRAQSGIKYGAGIAKLYINPRDIVLGEITGSKGSNAALESLIDQLGRAMTLTDSTT